MKSTPRLPSAQRKALIEAAAARHFSEHGYEATSLADIAAAAGITKPILYRHFASKKALYLAILERHREAQLEEARSATGQSLIRRLPRLVDAWFASVAEHPEAWMLILRDSTGDAEIAAVRARAQETARGLIVSTLAGRADATTAPEVEAAAELLRSAMAGLALWSLDHPECPRQVLVDLTVRVARALLEREATRHWPSLNDEPVEPAPDHESDDAIQRT
jgi:AcrR family transcriptional regulator